MLSILPSQELCMLCYRLWFGCNRLFRYFFLAPGPNWWSYPEDQHAQITGSNMGTGLQMSGSGPRLLTLRWRHNGRDGVSNHQPRDCLLNRLFRHKAQSSASLAFVRGIHRGPVNSPHIWPVTRKMFPFDDVIIDTWWLICFSELGHHWFRRWLITCSEACHYLNQWRFVRVGKTRDFFNKIQRCHLTKCVRICRQQNVGHLFGVLLHGDTMYENAFCVTGPLWGESAGDPLIPPTKVHAVTRNSDVPVLLVWTNCCTNRRVGWWFETPYGVNCSETSGRVYKMKIYFPWPVVHARHIVVIPQLCYLSNTNLLLVIMCAH